MSEQTPSVEVPNICINGVTRQMTEEEHQEFLAIQTDVAASMAARVPAEVSMQRARLALLNHGLLDQVDTVIAAMPEPDKTKAKIAWEYSGVVQRTHPLITTLGTILGLDDAALDNLFREADAIP